MPYDPRRIARRLIRAPGRRSLRRVENAEAHTRRPLGSGGRGVRLLDPGVWAQARFFGYGDSQLPPIDRPRSPTTVGPTGFGGGPPIETLLVDAGVGCERSQYTVSISAVENINPDPYIGDPVLTRQDVLNTGVGLSQLQVRLQWSLGAGRDNVMDLDIGAGFQLSLPATRVQMSLLLPAGAIDLDSFQGRTIPEGPIDPVTGGLAPAFNSALVWGTVNRNPGGNISGNAEWQLTRGFFVPAGTSTTIAIPQGADFVEGLEISAPVASTAFLNFFTAGGLDVGQWSGNFLVPKSFFKTRIPGTAKSIGSGPVNGASDRFFSLIFTMRP